MQVEQLVQLVQDKHVGWQASHRYATLFLNEAFGHSEKQPLV